MPSICCLFSRILNLALEEQDTGAIESANHNRVQLVILDMSSKYCPS